MQLNLTLSELKDKLRSEFYNVDELITVVYNALKFGDNLILYGPGGFGKSEIVSAILKHLGLPEVMVVGYEDMPVERLIGLPDMEKMTKESIYETAFDRSPFAQSGVLVLEEFLEVAPATIAAMKDIITSGGLRQNDKFYKSNIESIIICTNKSPDEIATNSVLKALVNERFPIHYQVIWSRFDTKAYLDFITFIIGKENVKDEHCILADLCARNAEPVSPRTVLNCISRAEENLEYLKHVNGLDTSELDGVIVQYRAYKIKQSYLSMQKDINNYITALLQKDLKLIRVYNDTISSLRYIKSKLIDIQCDDAEISDILYETSKQVNNAIGFVETNFTVLDDIDKEPINKIFEQCTVI